MSFFVCVPVTLPHGATDWSGIWASTLENLSSGLTNSKGTDQPAHPRSLISAFGIRFLESIISKLATSGIPFFSSQSLQLRRLV